MTNKANRRLMSLLITLRIEARKDKQHLKFLNSPPKLKWEEIMPIEKNRFKNKSSLHQILNKVSSICLELRVSIDIDWKQFE